MSELFQSLVRQVRKLLGKSLVWTELKLGHSTLRSPGLRLALTLALNWALTLNPHPKSGIGFQL